MSLYNGYENAPDGIKKCMEEFAKSYYNEIHESEEKVFAYMEEHFEDYSLGIKGGDLLKYSMMPWIESADEMIAWVFEHLEKIMDNNEETSLELFSLRSYYDAIYHDRLQPNTIISEFFIDLNHDIVQWFESKSLQSLVNFKKRVKYSVEQTEVSALDKATVWQSFGFQKSEDYEQLPSGIGRLYPTRLRRSVSLS